MPTAPKNVLTTAVRQLYADPAAAAAESVDKIAAARVWLLKEKPFFGVLARALIVEPTLEVTAFRVTADDRLRANALVTLELPFPALCGRIAHLALHAALGAHVRRATRDPLRWNAAHDLAIAPLLRAAGLSAEPTLEGAEQGGLPLDELAPGASAEQYYALLPEGARPHDLWCDLAAPPPPPGEAPPAGTFTRQDDGEGDEEPGEQAGRGGKGDAGRDQEAGDQDEAEDERDEGDSAGDAMRDRERRERPGDPTPPVEARARELQWKIRLGAALEEERASGGKTFGDVPAWIEELVRATIEPPPDWSATLQRSVSMLTRSDRSFIRPSRRLAALVGPDGEWPDVVAIPGRRVVPAGRLVAVIDTSSSIDEGTVARFLGALAAVATAEGFDEVRLVQADADVTRDETVQAAELLLQAIAVVGRGGTDFGPALRALAGESRRQGERFTVVYLTDLDGRFPRPEEARPLEVLWVVPGKASKPPPFGKLLEMGPRAVGARR